MQHFPYFFILIGVLLSAFTKKLTVSASLVGGLLAVCIYSGAGVPGLILLALFFLLGSFATIWQYKTKAQLNLEDEHGKSRSWGQVLANGGVPALVALLALLFPESKPLFVVMLAASFSAATSDTLSSELGNLYGRNFYNVITLRRDVRGLDGVVSLEGCMFGLAGAFIIAAVYSGMEGWTSNFWLVFIGGIVGNWSDSVLGATLERAGFIKNNVVNFINTAIAALLVFLLY